MSTATTLGRYHYSTRFFDYRDPPADAWRPTDFQRGAIEASFFTAHPLPSSGEFSIDWDEQWNKLDEADRVAFIERCEAFERRFPKLLERACADTGNDMEHAGRDYHYTSAGHGCGFYDGDWKGDSGKDYSDWLERACELLPCHEIHGDLECDHFRESGEGCGDCDGCEAGPLWYLEQKGAK